MPESGIFKQTCRVSHRRMRNKNKEAVKTVRAGFVARTGFDRAGMLSVRTAGDRGLRYE